MLSGDRFYIFVRGNGNTIVTGSDKEDDAWKLSTTQTDRTIDCTGNIETLRAAEGNEESATVVATACYRYLFANNTALKTAPALSATTMVDFCYADMFKGCTALTEAPALPAKVLKTWCYEGVFDSCTSLKKPADFSHVTTIESYFNTDYGTTEFNHCGEMYNNCNSLKIYTVPTDDCKTPWLCTQVEGQKDSDWLTWVFNGTVGDVGTDLNGNAKAGVTYYILSDKTNNVVDTGVRGSVLCTGLSLASLLGLCVVVKRNTKKPCQ